MCCRIHEAFTESMIAWVAPPTVHFCTCEQVAYLADSESIREQVRTVVLYHIFDGMDLLQWTAVRLLDMHSTTEKKSHDWYELGH